MPPPFTFNPCYPDFKPQRDVWYLLGRIEGELKMHQISMRVLKQHCPRRIRLQAARLEETIARIQSAVAEFETAMAQYEEDRHAAPAAVERE